MINENKCKLTAKTLNTFLYLRKVDPDVSQVDTERGHHTADTAHHTATTYCQRPGGRAALLPVLELIKSRNITLISVFKFSSQV